MFTKGLATVFATVIMVVAFGEALKLSGCVSPDTVLGLGVGMVAAFSCGAFTSFVVGESL